MKLIGWNANWLKSDHLDLMAVYRRPRTQAITKAPLSDEAGRPLWDYVNLPIRRHNDWTAKGYEYVTLARVSDLIAAGVAASPDLLASYARIGEPEQRTFDMTTYLTYAETAGAAEHDALAELVHEHGSAAAEAILRHGNPAFVLPESLKHIAPRAVRETGVAGGGLPREMNSAEQRARSGFDEGVQKPLTPKARKPTTRKPKHEPKEPVQA